MTQGRYRRIVIAVALTVVSGLGLIHRVEAQTAGAFAQRGFGSRGISLGNAQVADVFGFGSPWYNPSLAPFYEGQSVEASYTFLSNDRTLEYVQFLVPMKPKAGIAAGLIHAGVSDIDGRDGSGYHTEYYSADEFAGFLAFGSRVGKVASIGISFRFYRSDLLPDLDPATSIGLAIGSTFRINDAWAVGASIDDLLARYEWDTSNVFGSSGRKTTDDFPVRLRVGTTRQFLDRNLLVSAEYESRLESVRITRQEIQVVGGTPRVIAVDDDRTLHSGSIRLGGEYRFADVFYVRLGFDRILDGAASEVIPTLGFSVAQQLGELGATFEYAFGREAYSLGSFHVIGIHLNI